MIKNLEAALEMVGTEHTEQYLDKYDLVHVLSPLSDVKTNEAFDSGKPVIMSAFYSEGIADFSFLEELDTESKYSISLSNRYINFLNRSNLLLVPNENLKKFAIDGGITCPIKVGVPGINTARFKYCSDEEKEIFFRYFKEDKNRKIVIGVGEFVQNLDGINAFIDAAKKSPEARFYYFGIGKHLDRIPFSIKRKIKSAPKNARFYSNIPEDVYVSTLVNASVFMIPGYSTPSILTIMDAMASKCQLICRKNLILDGYVENESTGYLAEFSETLGILVREYLSGDIKPTIDKAYDFAMQHDISVFGKNLNAVYKNLIK